MFKRQTDKLQIPVELCKYVQNNGLQKSFAIFLFLKFNSSGKLHKDSLAFKSINQDLGIKDSRTFNKHFGKLLTLNWIRLSQQSGYFFIRGFDRIRLENQFKSRLAATLYYDNLTKTDAFLVAAILGAEVKRQKYFWEVVKRKLKTVANKWDATIPSKAYADRPQPKYYGLGLHKSAQLLGCKKTRASQLRRKAANAGFISIRHKFIEIARMPKPDYNVRDYLNQYYQEFQGKIRFSRIEQEGVASIQVLLQLHDEIIPQLEFKSISKFNNLGVAPHLKAAVTKRINKSGRISS